LYAPGRDSSNENAVIVVAITSGDAPGGDAYIRMMGISMGDSARSAVHERDDRSAVGRILFSFSLRPPHGFWPLRVCSPPSCRRANRQRI